MTMLSKRAVQFVATPACNTAMTDDIADMLAALCQAAGKSFDPRLSLSQALHQIDELRDKLDFQLRTRSALAANLPGKVTSSRLRLAEAEA